jgi:hypothetical protein
MSVTEAQLEAVVERAVMKALENVGLKVDDADHQYEANADFRWVRANRQDPEFAKTMAFAESLRKHTEGISGAIGLAVITVIVGGLGWLLLQGANFWKVH